MEYQDRQQEVATFVNMMKALTHEWGFVVVHTATTLTDDQLATALANLRALVLANQDSGAEMDPGTLALPLMLLPSANISAARATFNDWISAYDDIGSEWDSDVRRDVFIAVDDAAMESLLAVDGSGEPWVLVVDAKYSESVRARQDYPGYMRCLVRSLWTLSDDLEDGDWDLEALTPARQYADQTPLFDGSLKGKVVEPEQPTSGPRVEFSRGTQKGVAAGTQRGVQGGTQRSV